MKHLLRCLLVVSLLLFVGCHRSSLPEGIVDQERMTDFLADVYLMEGYYAISTQYRYDIFTDEMKHAYDSILDLHGLTREQAERSLDYYTAHLDLYQAIHDSVVVRLEAQSEEDKDGFKVE